MATFLKLDPDLEERVEAIAGQHEKPASWIMREAIRQYVEREEARADFASEARASWIEFQQTGEHLTGDEVGDWLRRWGTSGETAAPKCHD